MKQCVTANNPTFVFRTDSSTLIGTGHLMRCMRLASALRETGSLCVFVCRDLEGNQGTLVAEHGFDLFYLTSETTANHVTNADRGYESWLPVSELEDAIDTREIIEKFDNVKLIIDHYSLGLAWEQTVRDRVSEIVVVDDLYGRIHDCDIFINPSVTEFDDSTFSANLPIKCTQLLGPKFALLDSSYSKLNASLQQRQRARVQDVFVSFGGVDQTDWTIKIVEILSQNEFKDLNVHIVIGTGYSSFRDLKALCDARGKTKLHCQINNVQEVMSECDMAIGAGGTMSWERLCLGLPSVILGVAENQYDLVNELLAKGLCIGNAVAHDLSKDYVSFLIRYLIDNFSLRQAIAENGKKFVDGKGLHRVAKVLNPTEFHFRDVSVEDAGLIFEWRTDESVASVSTTGKPDFDFQDHLAWLRSTVEDKNRVFVIAEVAGVPTGVCRFDISGDTAVISIYYVPDSKKHGGLIKAASSWFFENFPEVPYIKAEVLADNETSHAAFSNSGYRQSSTWYQQSAPRFKLRDSP